MVNSYNVIKVKHHLKKWKIADWFLLMSKDGKRHLHGQKNEQTLDMFGLGGANSRFAVTL